MKRKYTETEKIAVPIKILCKSRINSQQGAEDIPEQSRILPKESHRERWNSVSVPSYIN